MALKLAGSRPSRSNSSNTPAVIMMTPQKILPLCIGISPYTPISLNNFGDYKNYILFNAKLRDLLQKLLNSPYEKSIRGDADAAFGIAVGAVLRRCQTLMKLYIALNIIYLLDRYRIFNIIVYNIYNKYRIRRMQHAQLLMSKAGTVNTASSHRN
jgi:hypothetical protein